MAALAFLVAAVAIRRARQGRGADTGRAVLAAALVRLAVAAALVLSATGALEPRWPAGFWLACLAWVSVLKPHGHDDPPALSALRRLAPPLGALQVLHAYPVAGSQVAWGSFLLVLVAFLCALDGVRQLAAWERPRTEPLLARLRLPEIGGALLLVLVAAGFVAPLARMRKAYAQLPSLALPGAHLLHLPRAQVKVLHELVAELANRCDTFVTLPGLNSLFLWSEKEPPTGSNATTWMFLFDDALQERIVARLETIERLCLVRAPQLAESWAGGRPLPERPLLAYLRDRFELVERVGEYELWERRPGTDAPGR